MSRTSWLPSVPAALGIAACAACCAAPLVAVVVGAGAASTVAAIAEPVAGVLLAATLVAVGAVVFVRRRQAAAASCAETGACKVDASCGCDPATDERTARAEGCTLEAEALPGRKEAFRSLFGRALTRREVTGTRAVWTFAWSPEVEAEARRLAAAESGCCSFYSFDLERRGDQLRWTTTVPPGREAGLAMLDRLAQGTSAAA